MKKIKIKFTVNYSPRKKGEVAELEAKLANHYISTGVAKLAEAKDKVGLCKGCGDAVLEDMTVKELKAYAEEKEIELTATKQADILKEIQDSLK